MPGLGQMTNETTAAFVRRAMGKSKGAYAGTTAKTKAAYGAAKRRVSAQKATRRTRGDYLVGADKKKSWFKGISNKNLQNVGMAVMLAMMVKKMVGEEVGYRQAKGMQNVQAEHMQAMQGMGGEDAYYAAALPELQAERRMATQALMQTILGGQGMSMMPVQVPGERVIGGQGGY